MKNGVHISDLRTYSIKDNIAATDSNLVKAIYEFGVAAKAYRAILEAQA